MTEGIPGKDRLPETDEEAEQVLQDCIDHPLGKKTVVHLYRVHRMEGMPLLEAFKNTLEALVGERTQ